MQVVSERWGSAVFAGALPPELRHARAGTMPFLRVPDAAVVAVGSQVEHVARVHWTVQRDRDEKRAGARRRHPARKPRGKKPWQLRPRS